MRDPQRIETWVQCLGNLWQTYAPDLRFGQLMSNFFDYVASVTHRDIYYIEDEEMQTLLTAFFQSLVQNPPHGA